MVSPVAVKAALGSVFRSARAAVGGTALVLTYHRVIELDSDPQLLTITPQRFEDQIAILAQRFNVIRASELREMLLHKRRIPRNSVVVTFDDGYHDLLTVIKPILERHSVPATAFISTDLIGSDREQWWDELEPLLLRAPDGSGDLAWDITMPPRNESQRLYVTTCDQLKRLGAAERESSLDEIAGQRSVDRSPRPEYRMLNANEIRELASGGLIDIGSHTASHQMLSASTLSAQLHEIAEGKRTLQAILGKEIELFSYPYGGTDALGPETRSLVAETGHSCGFANWFGLTFPWTDPYAIPRCPTENLDGRDFAGRLEQWFTMGR
ncbi:MAG: polysaccharide deacetylase family protein [Actinobacteria bacterium]|nr:polysaccharide deacetylase family protein [Actinomycetota bacterium]MCG2806943.1 polysaccharide deacetylase family protein [Coriobacteriia bacterium]